jgi:hypothetical protein
MDFPDRTAVVFGVWSERRPFTSAVDAREFEWK